MSMELMVQAMSAKVGNPLRKLVLLKLADNANDNGECWPSYQYIADQCEIGRSTVKNHIKALIDLGFLKMEARNDGKSSNLYILTISKGKAKSKLEEGENSLNTVKLEHGQDLTQSDDDLTRSGFDPVTRSGADPRTSHSLEPVIEPIKESKPKKPAKPSVLEKLSSQYPTIGPESIQFALDHRKAKKAAMTDRGSKLFFDEVLNCSHELGISPERVIDVVIERDWKGVNTEWVRKHLIDNAPPVQQQLAITQTQNNSATNNRQAVHDAINDIHDTNWM